MIEFFVGLLVGTVGGMIIMAALIILDEKENENGI